MEKHDLDIIYEQLKDKYDLLLTNTFALDDGYDIDVPVLRGKSRLGRFDLYQEDEDWHEFVFTMEYAEPKAEEKYTHWHPQSKEQAIAVVIAFMEGTQALPPLHDLPPKWDDFPSPTQSFP